MFKALVGAAAGIFTLFGASTTGDHRPVHVEDRGLFERHASSTIASVDVACVAAAVAAREAALGTAASANAQALTTAYSDRASALAAAYTQTGKDAIRKAVKNAWSHFGAALRLAHKSWKSAQQAAWSHFRTAVKACGAGAANVSDSSNASLDVGAGAGSD